jgi:heme exporter protein A
MPLLTFDQIVDPFIPLSKTYPFSGTLEKGQSLVLKGWNGSGKTSLLKILADLIKPLQGSVQSQPSFYCGHQTGLKCSWTVEQNLSFRAALYGQPISLFNEIIAYLKEFKLYQFLYQQVSCLSRGQQQQIALLSGLLSPYKLWLLDEPFAHLDTLSLQQWREIIKTFCKEGGGVVYSTHHQIFSEDIVLNL